MSTRHERTVELDAPLERLAPRLMDWARASGFVCTAQAERVWRFRRGGWWRKWFSLDQANAPTDAVVEVVAESPLTLRTSMVMRPALDMDTLGDRGRVKEQVDRLVAYLRGVYDF